MNNISQKIESMKILELRDYAKNLGIKSAYKYKKNELKELVYDFLNKNKIEEKNQPSDTKIENKPKNNEPEKSSEPPLLDYAPKSQAGEYKQHIEKEKEKNRESLKPQAEKKEETPAPQPEKRDKTFQTESRDKKDGEYKKFERPYYQKKVQDGRRA